MVSPLTLRIRQALRRAWHGLVPAAAAVCAVAVSACTLPYDQLGLPTKIGPSETGGGVSTGSIHNGGPLGSPGSPEAQQPRSFPGSGQFAGDPRAQPSRATGAAAGDGFTLDLANASVAEAARTVLGDIMQVNYTVSEKVNAQVTLKTARPVSKAGLLEIFETVLQTQGVGMIETAGVYRVVPLDEAINSGKPMRKAGAPGPRGPGIRNEIVPLQFVSADEMQRILKSVSPESGVARADTDRNLLILTGSANELASMTETIRVFDVDWMRGMSFGIYPVESSDPASIAQELDTIFANDRQSPVKGMVKFVPNARLKAVLVITSRPEYLRKAETWINRIDLAGRATERSAYVYHVKYRPSSEIAQLLQKIYVPRRSASVSATSQSFETSSIDQQATAPGVAPGTVTSSNSTGLQGPAVSAVQGPAQPGTTAAVAPGDPAPLSNDTFLPSSVANGAATTATQTAAAATATFGAAPPDDRSSGISIIADEGNNTVVITATTSEIKRIRQVLSEVDVMPAQVLLEATIAEVTLNDELKFGLRWFFKVGASRLKLTDLDATAKSTEDKSILASVAPAIPGFSYFLNFPNAQVVVNALASITNVDVISSPSLTVLNNKKAVLQIGDEVPVATQSAVGVLTPDAPIVNAISFRNTGVILSITPRVNDDGRVLLEIEQEVSDVKATTTSTIDSPTIQQRRIKTTVSVPDGESIVLAGLMQDKATRGRDQIPVAGDIPLVGNLFKNKDDRVERTELLIAITPHVIKDSAQSGAIAAEFRDRLNFTTRPQRDTPPDRREQVDRLVR